VQSPAPWFILFLAFVLLAPGVAAFSVESTTVTPDVLNPGDTVNVTSTVYAASGTAFSSFDDLQTVTGLDDAVWTYTVIVNEVENTRPSERGDTLTIGGYELSYRNQDEVIVKYLLKGTVPSTTPPGSNITLITFQELDARGKVITSSVAKFTHRVGLPTPAPTPEYGSIVVSSEPAGANVYLDNTIKGITPMTIKVVPNGPHSVLLRQEGYQDYTQTVTVTADAPQVSAVLSKKSVPEATVTYETTVSSTVTTGGIATAPQPATQPETGSLSITTSPAGALVFIDGKMKGVTPATIPGLSPGSHTIRLVLDGYQDLETITEIAAGANSEFVTGLSKRKQLPGFTIALALAALGILLGAREIRNRKQ
jgi:hypothetical protein